MEAFEGSLNGTSGSFNFAHKAGGKAPRTRPPASPSNGAFSGLVGHTHAAAAWVQTPRGATPVQIRVGEPLDLAEGKWPLNPGAVGAPVPPRRYWWDALDVDATEGASWLLLDLERHTATWRRTPYDPAPARERARMLGLDTGRT